MDLDFIAPDWSMSLTIDESTINEKVQQIILKASNLQGDNRISSLVKAITCIDLTTLRGDDTESKVEFLCKKAANPIDSKFEWPEKIHTAAVCVYPAKAITAVNALKALKPEICVKVACVAAGFPSGQYPLATRLSEIEYAVSYGVDEIDVVIDRSLVLTHKWKELYTELQAMRKACGTEVRMKTILSVGELSNNDNIYCASIIAMYAGSDFIKTSTGQESVNATLPAGLVLCIAIKDFYELKKQRVGFKPAGGIKTSQQALEWLVLIEDELGEEWLNKDLFRIGASSLLDDIVETISSDNSHI